ncbi:Inherit from bactNOG: aspartyl asparaginyl beta-hydroxylase [Seminavis robusta]|uniref:Inherit from bactNOG: aspartyl asparaginyl beta-hydroxylase n=1 Tax=Seminavis robusta TaxID=568900 RepID=A0A9N8E2M0_9STRA|nr:Inherit from bactNOG: aspartyl asparaginyl beta-hydroxylase [Seminavis robusta]|eukprot:Sro442_g143930.1 Inherit from bactNOG: aspartyl asparaginyl beta-hydroxylase (535) ;mRNA; r:45591-47485
MRSQLFYMEDMSHQSHAIESGDDIATTGTKGNDGKSPYQRQRRLCRIFSGVMAAFFAYQMFVAHVLAGMVPDIEVDKETGRKRIRRRPERLQKMGLDGKMRQRTPLDGIIEGHLHLIDITVPTHDAITSTRYNVQGTFCVIEWAKQQKDPASVPLFSDLIESSALCSTTTHTADLYDVAYNARQWDLHMRNNTLNHDIWKREQNRHIPQPEAAPIERSIPPTAFVFHESRCGSTLVSNLLAAFSPETTKVYSEAAAPLKALQACSHDGEKCPSQTIHRTLVRDVFYMMGRTQRGDIFHPDHNVFYKLQPAAVHYIPLLETSLSQPVPWMYLYRDNVHVMQSHFQGSVIDPTSEETNFLGVKKAPKCLDGYRSTAEQPPVLTQLVARQGRTVQSLSAEEYCAAYLASLSESAMQHYHTAQKQSQWHQKTPHFFVSYRQLPDVIWDHVLPSLGMSLKAKDIHRMEKVAALYTQGRTSGKKQMVFTGDNAHKEANVPAKIDQAAHVFMDATFAKLEALANATLKAPKMANDEEDEGA